jgi:hypothetical protein
LSGIVLVELFHLVAVNESPELAFTLFYDFAVEEEANERFGRVEEEDFPGERFDDHPSPLLEIFGERLAFDAFDDDHDEEHGLECEVEDVPNRSKAIASGEIHFEHLEQKGWDLKRETHEKAGSSIEHPWDIIECGA